MTTTANYCEGRVASDSIYSMLHRECFDLFPDVVFEDLFTDVGRHSVPPMIVAVVMVLQRVLDSTPLYDAVSTMDTVTLVRSICGLLGVADAELEAVLRAGLSRDDDYSRPGKPVCDYDDPVAREALVDALARDAMALLAILDGRELGSQVDKAAQLVATVVGQDLEQAEGVFRIARRVAPDRVISTVDVEARHGHKTSARGFDGYKGHTEPVRHQPPRLGARP